jgi:hypothetical protein
MLKQSFCSISIYMEEKDTLIPEKHSPVQEIIGIQFNLDMIYK